MSTATQPAWEARFRELWDRSIARYEAGRQSPSALLAPDDIAFLRSLNCSPQEFFDYIEDSCGYGEPDVETALAVERIRFNHWANTLGSRPPGPAPRASSLPAKTDEVDGIAWLPRLIVKARLKLKGELPTELMYGCGGDRPFLRRASLNLPRFLELVRDNPDSDRPIIDAVKGGLAGTRRA